MKACSPQPVCAARSSEFGHRPESGYIEQPFDVPDPGEPQDEPEEPSDLDDFDLDQDDDARWDVFIPDDDEYDPEPDASDFDGGWEPGAWSDEPE